MRKPRFGREFYTPKGATLARGVEGETAAYTYDLAGGLYALGFWGKASKPNWHYEFRTEAERQAKIAGLFDGFESHQKMMAERRQQRAAEACKTPADVYRKARTGDGYISTADDAVLIRAALAKAFPGTTFSVRSDVYSGGSSIDVEWTDGPERREVEAVAGTYAMGGFDGMIDMAYSVSLWLAPDGRASLAHSPGTQGSAGSDPEQIGSPNDPQATQIRGGADYVHCNRHESVAA